MTTGIFALAGVLIGALATATMQWFFERRREQRSALVAARLVREDVVEAGSALETLLLRGWFEGLQLDVSSWQPNRSVLAAELSRDAWDGIAKAMQAVGHVQTMLAALLPPTDGELAPSDIPQDGREIVTETIKALEHARDRLDPLT